MHAFETPPKTNQGPWQRWDSPTIHVRDLPQMSETDLRRYEGQLILWESIPGFRGNSYFVDLGVKTVCFYTYINNRLQVLDILYQYHRCCLILEWQIHSPVWKISYPLNTGFLPSTELQSSKKLPTTSSLHNPTKLIKSAPKKNKNAKRIYTKHSSRAILPDNFPPCPGFPLSTTRPLCLVLRQSRHCQSRSAGGSGATWRGTSLKRRNEYTALFLIKISPTKNSCGIFCAMFMVLSHKLMAPKCFKKLLFLQSQRDKDTINLPSVPTPSIPSQKTKIHQQSHSWAISAPEASDCQKRCLCPVIHTSIFCTTSDGELWGKIMRFFIFGVCPPRMHWKKIFWDYKTPNIICGMINPQIHTGSSFLNGSLVPNRRTQRAFDNTTRLAGNNAIACEDPLPTDPNNPKISVANFKSLKQRNRMSVVALHDGSRF